MMRTGVIAAVLFVLAHFAMLIGVTTPEKFYFDEVHYVPAARQMLEPVMPEPMLNPMHPPLAKQLIALSIHWFGDGPLGWRYPGVLFGSLAIVAVYLCGLALFAAQGPAIAASLLAFFNQMLFVQSRIAMLDIFALTFSLFAIAAFMHGFRRERSHLWFALAGAGFGLSAACKWGVRNSLTPALMIGTGPISGPISDGGISPSVSCSFRRPSISRRSCRSTVFRFRIFCKRNGGFLAITPRLRSLATPI
jgi:dolichyl-phosphate-mannose--protein O-mannosyl transferase